jgi:Fur family transcriptional regulator, ferric uptake regulator
MSELTGKLRRSSRKITGPRQAILKILRKQSHPLTTKEILSETDKIDLATIYRAMHLLEKMQMVKRIDFGDGVARFELAGEGDDNHHHHLICTKCGSIIAIEECILHEIESRLAAAHNFSSVSHKLEFFGICSRCQKGGKSK